MVAHHELMDGRLHVYKRDNSRYWQCSSFFAGKNHRESTKEESLAQAKDFAEDWYLDLKGKVRRGEVKGGKTFKQAADQFLREIEALTAGERCPTYVYTHTYRLNVHLLPFFGKKALAEITPGMVQEYRIHRMTSRKDPKMLKALRDPKTGKVVRDAEGRVVKDQSTGTVMRPTRSTLHKEIVTLRQVLKCANRQGWIPYLPDLSAPFRASGKISHRAWFSPAEYKQLYEATGKRAENPPKPRWRRSCEQLHDYVLIMANTGLRPDEAARLEFRDVAIVKDKATGERILEIEVRGKRGVGFCKSMPNAVFYFERLKKRLREEEADVAPDGGTKAERRPDEEAKPKKKKMVLPGPADRLFDMSHSELFRTVLTEEKLRTDRDGQARTAYSLRHTYICMRLMEGADIYQVAKNCRTSVEMIEKYYASHLKNTLDASAINVRKGRKFKAEIAAEGREVKKKSTPKPTDRKPSRSNLRASV